MEFLTPEEIVAREHANHERLREKLRLFGVIKDDRDRLIKEALASGFFKMQEIADLMHVSYSTVMHIKNGTVFYVKKRDRK